MPKHLASNCGTKKDRVICQFYSKVGACLHGNRCKWFHNRPTSSPTLLLSNMYQRLDNITPGNDAEGNPIDPHKLQEHFEDFYEDIFQELSKHGEIESLIVCDNLADHMIGNVYVQFRDEGQAEAAMKGLRERPYKGRPIIVDFSPVTDFYEATCGQFKVDRCNKGADCNYIHVKQISPYLRKQLYSESRSRSPSYRRDIKSRERSHERGDHRRSSERDIESERRTRSKGRSRSLRESRERSQERGDHRGNSERNIGKERGLREGQEAKGGRGEES